MWNSTVIIVLYTDLPTISCGSVPFLQHCHILILRLMLALASLSVEVESNVLVSCAILSISEFGFQILFVKNKLQSAILFFLLLECSPILCWFIK